MLILALESSAKARRLPVPRWSAHCPEPAVQRPDAQLHAAADGGADAEKYRYQACGRRRHRRRARAGLVHRRAHRRVHGQGARLGRAEARHRRVYARGHGVSRSRGGGGALVCAAMDARRSQIYNALFEIRGGKPVRLCEDRAIRSRSWAKNWEKCRNPLFWLATAHSCVIIRVWTWASLRCWRRAIWSARARGAWPWPPSGRRGPGGGTAPGLSAPVAGRAGTPGTAGCSGGARMKN